MNKLFQPPDSNTHILTCWTCKSLLCCIVSVTRRSRSDGSHSLSHWLSEWTLAYLTDVTLVSDDIFEEVFDDGEDIFEEVFDNGKEIFEEYFDDGEDIFEEVFDDVEDIRYDDLAEYW